jgi:hypothetical protein
MVNVIALTFVKNPRVSLEGDKGTFKKHREIVEGAKILPRGQRNLGVPCDEIHRLTSAMRIPVAPTQGLFGSPIVPKSVVR